MDHQAAEDQAAKLRREHPDRLTHTWMARGTPDGAWDVVKVRIPGGLRTEPLKGTVEAKPKPPQADDPRSSAHPNIPPFGAA